MQLTGAGYYNPVHPPQPQFPSHHNSIGKQQDQRSHSSILYSPAAAGSQPYQGGLAMDPAMPMPLYATPFVNDGSYHHLMATGAHGGNFMMPPGGGIHHTQYLPQQPPHHITASHNHHHPINTTNGGNSKIHSNGGNNNYNPPKVNSKGQSTVLSTDNLIVRNLDKSITTEELRAFYAPYGAIKSCEVRRSHQTSESQGYGFVQFVEERAAQKALEATKGRTMRGLTLNVRFAYAHADPLPAPDDSTRITVGNFPATIDPETIVELVGRVGSQAPKSCLSPEDAQTGTSFAPLFIRTRDVVSAEGTGSVPPSVVVLLDVHTTAMVQFLIEQLNTRTVTIPRLTAAPDASTQISAEDASPATQEALAVVLQVRVAESQQQMQQRQRRKQLKEGISTAVPTDSSAHAAGFAPLPKATTTRGSVFGPASIAGAYSTSSTSLSSVTQVSPMANPSLLDAGSGVFGQSTTPRRSSPQSLVPIHRSSFPSNSSNSQLVGNAGAFLDRSENPLFFIVPNSGGANMQDGQSKTQASGDSLTMVAQPTSARLSGGSFSLEGTAPQLVQRRESEKTATDGIDQSVSATSSSSAPLFGRKQQLQSRLRQIAAVLDSSLHEDSAAAALEFQEVEQAVDYLGSVVNALFAGVLPTTTKNLPIVSNTAPTAAAPIPVASAAPAY